DTNVSREVITDGSGRYRAAALQPGRYEVSATLSGFEIKPVSDVPVTVGQTVPVDLKMHTAGIAEDVVVTAQSPVIDTRRTDVSQASIKEFQVGVSNMSAEFGRAAGGTVNAVTKSGTNRFRGEGFYFLRDKAFQAINPKVPLVNGEKPDERRQQFGVGVGGPI